MTDDPDVDDDEDEPIHALEVFPLERLIGIRPPWHWANLEADERGFLEVTLDLFVTDYNNHFALKPDHLIPACWRHHPYMNQVLPVLFFAWINAHRTATAYFNVHGRPPAEVAAYLAEHRVNVWHGHNYAWELTGALGIRDAGSAVRAGLVHYNDRSDVERLLAALAALADARRVVTESGTAPIARR